MASKGKSAQTTFLLERGFVHFHVSWWELFLVVADKGDIDRGKIMGPSNAIRIPYSSSQTHGKLTPQLSTLYVQV